MMEPLKFKPTPSPRLCVRKQKVGGRDLSVSIHLTPSPSIRPPLSLLPATGAGRMAGGRVSFSPPSSSSVSKQMQKLEREGGEAIIIASAASFLLHPVGQRGEGKGDPPPHGTKMSSKTCEPAAPPPPTYHID